MLAHPGCHTIPHMAGPKLISPVLLSLRGASCGRRHRTNHDRLICLLCIFCHPGAIRVSQTGSRTSEASPKSATSPPPPRLLAASLLPEHIRPSPSRRRPASRTRRSVSPLRRPTLHSLTFSTISLAPVVRPVLHQAPPADLRRPARPHTLFINLRSMRPTVAPAARAPSRGSLTR